MKDLKTFQVVLIGIFLAFAVGGMVFFMLFKGFGGNVNPYGKEVIIWGTFDDASFVDAFSALNEADSNFKVVQYREKDVRTFERDLVNALAEGGGPDIVILPHDMLVSQRPKIRPISYEQYPVRTYKDTYIDGAEIFALRDGIYALPVAVDPLIVYWNRDIFATKGLSTPPRTWEELVSVTVPAVVERTVNFDILRAALAFGEYSNVRNAKEILLMLFLQSGSLLVTEEPERYDVVLDRSAVTTGLPPASAALRFFTEFSNPAKSVYTWSRAQKEDREAFLAGDLALYIGFGSEYEAIRIGNPNLNFDIAEIPQGADARLKKGYGTFYGAALMRNSSNIAGASNALRVMTSKMQSEGYAEQLKLGPVYRSSFSGTVADPLLAVIARATLVARGWLDPAPIQSDTIFKQMVEDVTSGRMEVEKAVSDAEGRLRILVD